MNEYMKEAVELSAKNLVDKYGGPFGAVIVKDGKIIGRGRNRVIADKDPTAHAEMRAIENACDNINSYDLTGCTLYTSCYPCPMCLSAIIWSNIKKVYYANTRKDADEIGFRDKIIYDFIENKMNNDILDLEQLEQKEALEVFDKYKNDENRVEY